MAIKTIVCWDPTPENQDALKAALSRQVSIGNTDGSFEIDEGYIIRPWNTIEAAQAWVDFVNSFDPPPISTEVYQEPV